MEMDLLSIVFALFTAVCGFMTGWYLMELVWKIGVAIGRRFHG